MPISPSGWGRFVAGGTGSTWVFFVPACVVLLFVVDAFLPPYYSPDYAKKTGPQMAMVRAMIDSLAGVGPDGG